MKTIYWKPIYVSFVQVWVIVGQFYNTQLIFNLYYLCGTLCCFMKSPNLHPIYLGVETLNMSQLLKLYHWLITEKNNKKFLSLKLKYQILSQVQQFGTSFMIFEKFYQIYYKREWKQAFILEYIAFSTFEKSKFSYCL